MVQVKVICVLFAFVLFCVVERKDIGYVSSILYRKDDNLPFKCYGDAANKTYEMISMQRCSLACNGFKDCLAFQYYNTRRCDLFLTWSIWIRYSINGCLLYTRADLCPPRFVYFPTSKTCYKLEVGSWNWEQARSWCNHLAPPFTFPAVINTQNKKDATDIYLNSISGQDYVPCFDTDFCSRKIWLGGQRVDPLNINTPFVWKPFPNISFSLGSKTFWYPGQPDAFGLTLNLESCLTYFSGTYLWNDLTCNNYFKCVLCEAATDLP